LDAVSKCVKITDVTYPNPENTEKYRKVFETYKKIHDALAPIYNER
jgi:sugar (pentulose or hexulose) kinase